MRFLHNEDETSFEKNFGWKKLEPISLEHVHSKSSFLKLIFNDCKQLGVPVLELVLFCAEGNNIPEALIMNNYIVAYLNWKPGKVITRFLLCRALRTILAFKNPLIVIRNQNYLGCSKWMDANWRRLAYCYNILNSFVEHTTSMWNRMWR